MSICIATPHMTTNEFDETKIQIGKLSRIQDGYLIHMNSLPKAKYDGVFFVIHCKIQQRPDGSFQLFGSNVSSFLERWNQVLSRVLATHSVTFVKQYYNTDTINVRTKRTKWFQYKKVYQKISQYDIDHPREGIAVITTKGPWFHTSKAYTSCRWHLLEFCSF